MFDYSDLYFTTVTVGKKGQIIIPAKLRKELSIAPEEQLIILSGPHQEGFAVLKTQSFIGEGYFHPSLRISIFVVRLFIYLCRLYFNEFKLGREHSNCFGK